MNPPFTRQGGQEADRVGIGNAAFAAFETTRPEQDAMQKRLREIGFRRCSPRFGQRRRRGVTFVDLALRKLRTGGTLAMVLPLSSMSGLTWDIVRKAVAERCTDCKVITIAAQGSDDRSFSADTGMAECLLIATQEQAARTNDPEATFVRAQSAAFGRRRPGPASPMRSARLQRSRPMSGTLQIGGRPLKRSPLEEQVGVSRARAFAGIRPVAFGRYCSTFRIAQAAFNLQEGELVQREYPSIES